MYIVVTKLFTVCECLALRHQARKNMKKRERFVNEEEQHQSKWGDLSIAIQRIFSPNIMYVAHELVELYSDKYLRACVSLGSPPSDTREVAGSRVIDQGW